MTDTKTQLDFNLLKVSDNNVAAIVGQEMVAHVLITRQMDRALSALSEQLGKNGKNVAKVAFKKAGQSAAGKRVGALLLGPRASAKIAKAASKRAARAVSAMIKKMVQKLLKEQATTTVTKVVGGAVAKEVAKGATVAATGCTYTGLATAGAGCVASLAAGAAMVVFDVFNFIADILDSNGLSIVYSKKFIQDMGTELAKSLDEAYTSLGYPDWLDEEVVFDVNNFIVDYDEETDTSVLSDEWGPRYLELRDEYIKSIGIKDGWAERMESSVVELKDQRSSVNKSKQKKKKYLLIMIFLLLFLLIF
jgi:hypothetical protein